MVKVKRSSFKVETPYDPEPLDPDTDPETLRRVSDGLWDVIGVMARVDVYLPGSGVMHRFESPGIWAVIVSWSPDDREYIEQLGEQEKDFLEGMLEELGVRVVP